MNHYQRLGLARDAGLEELELAFKRKTDEYHQEAHQGTIISKETWAALEKAYEDLKEHIIVSQKKQLPQGLKVLLLFLGLIAAITIPIVLAGIFHNDKFYWLFPVFFIGAIIVNTISLLRKHQKENKGGTYRGDHAKNKKLNQRSIIGALAVFGGLVLLSLAMGDEDGEVDEDLGEMVAGVMAVIVGLFLVWKDAREHRRR